MAFNRGNLNYLSLTRRKIPSHSQEAGLKRCMTKWNLMAYAIGCTVGAGVFVLTGQIARNLTGPSVCFSYLIGGLAAMLSGLCYAEFGSQVFITGSAYTYTYMSLGELAGWNLTFEYAVSAAACASSWSNYFLQLLSVLGLQTPGFLQNRRLNHLFSISPLALALVFFATCLLLSGVENFRRVATFTTCVNMFAMMFFILYGSFFVSIQNYKNFFPHGFQGTLDGAGATFFAYVGFDSVTNLSAEALYPSSDIPFALLTSLGFSALLYFLIGLVLTGMVPFEELNVSSPLTSAFLYHNCSLAAIFVGISSVSTMAVLTTCSMIGQPRVWFAMAKDGLLFSQFQKVDKNSNPFIGTLVTGCWTGFLAFFLDLSILSDIISAGILTALSMVCGGAIINRISPHDKNPNPFWTHGVNLAAVIAVCVGDFLLFLTLHHFALSRFHFSLLCIVLFIFPNAFLSIRYFSTPQRNISVSSFQCWFFPFLPQTAMAVNLYLTASLASKSLLYLLIWTLAGLVIYLLYGIHHSHSNKIDQNLESSLEEFESLSQTSNESFS